MSWWGEEGDEPEDWQEMPRNRLADFTLWLALALIVGSGLAAYEGAISTLAALGLLLLAGVACLVVAVVEARLEERG